MSRTDPPEQPRPTGIRVVVPDPREGFMAQGEAALARAESRQVLSEVKRKYENAMRERGDHDLLETIERHLDNDLPPVDWRELYRRAIAWKSALLDTYGLDEDALPSDLIEAIQRRTLR